VDYISRLIEKTARDDRALRRLGGLPVDDDDSAALLSVLFARWPHDQFDEVNIAVNAPYEEAMLAAVTPIIGKSKIVQRCGKSLSPDNERDICRWLLSVAGREIGGYRLERNRIGWCTIWRVA
jgi:hypothetical protein